MAEGRVSADTPTAELIHGSLELGLAAVLASERPCGGALLVDEKHLVTCAHVVNTALSRRPGDTRIPDSPVTVVFPYADDVQRSAVVTAWWPVGDRDGDVAVLRVLEGAPAGAQPVDMVTAYAVEGHRFKAWGFPQGRAGQMLAEGKLSRRRGDGRVQLDALAGTGQPVREGFSGAPVWDCELAGVVGMVQSRDPDTATRTGFLLPVDMIARLWPALPRREPARPEQRKAHLARVAGDRVSASVECWRDRDMARSELRRLVLTGPRIITVTGRRGIGKSAMVAKVLADFERADPSRSPLDDLDALAYLSTRTGSGTLTLARIYNTVASLAPVEDQERLAHRWDNAGRDALPALWESLRDRRLVVVLDNLDDMQDPDTGELRDDDVSAFLASACRTPYPQHVVTTSLRRPRLSPELLAHVASLELGEGLPPQDAVAVLRALERDGSSGIHELTDEQLTAVAARVHGVPRGLELLAQLLDDDPFAIEELITSDTMPEALLVELVGRSYTQLDLIGRDVVGILALAGVPLSLEALPHLLNGIASEVNVHATVRRLVRNRELGYDRTSGLLRLHPVDADFVREELTSREPGRQVTLDLRLADWYATRRTPASTWRELDDAAPNKWEFTHRWRAGEHEAALTALADAAEFLARRGEAQILRAAVRTTESRAITPTSIVHLEWCRSFGELFDGSLDITERALYKARAVASADDGPHHLLPGVNTWLGTVLRHRGEPAEAARIQRQVAFDDNLAVSLEWRRKALFELGLSLCYTRDLRGGEEVLDRLAALVRPEDRGHSRAQLADLRALTALVAGDRATALAAAAEGIAAYADSSCAEDAGYLHNVRGVVLLDADDLTSAAADLEHALATAQDFAVARLAGLVATNLAWLRLRQGRHEEAVGAAELGAERLTANGVKEAASPRALTALLSTATTRGTSEIRCELASVVAHAVGNADLYQPSEVVLDEMAELLIARSLGG